MIGPDEIRSKALKWWNNNSFLQAYAAGEEFFPRDIPFGKIAAREAVLQFSTLNQSIRLLREKSKEHTGSGYTLELTEINNQRIGRQHFPTRIYFESQEDYLQYIGKAKEFAVFVSLKELIDSRLPQLSPWVKRHPGKVIQEEENWEGLLKVCTYFLSNPKPQLFIRELPIAVHTKFIEEQKLIISELLSHLLGEEEMNAEFTGLRYNNFEKRFYLKYDESLIRFRTLDPALCIGGLSDISILPSEFAGLQVGCRKVFITENKMNCLTFPALREAIVVFGTGYGIKKLKGAAWLRDKEIYYWGDIDAHGFEILSQLRSYFPQTISLMMDRPTFDRFHAFSCTENSSYEKKLLHLNADEQEMYAFISNTTGNNRLEQEKINQSYVEEAVNRIR